MGAFQSLLDAGGVVFEVYLGCSWGPLRSCTLLYFSSSASSRAAKWSPEIECTFFSFCLANANRNMDSLNGHITFSSPFLVPEVQLLGSLPLFSLSFSSVKFRCVGVLYFHSSFASSWTTSGSLHGFTSYNPGLTAHLPILVGLINHRPQENRL